MSYETETPQYDVVAISDLTPAVPASDTDTIAVCQTNPPTETAPLVAMTLQQIADYVVPKVILPPPVVDPNPSIIGKALGINLGTPNVVTIPVSLALYVITDVIFANASQVVGGVTFSLDDGVMGNSATTNVAADTIDLPTPGRSIKRLTSSDFCFAASQLQLTITSSSPLVTATCDLYIIGFGLG